MDKLLDKIKKDFEEFSQRNKHIQDLIKKFDSGKATLSDIDAIAKATGYALQVAIKKMSQKMLRRLRTKKPLRQYSKRPLKTIMI